MEIYHQKMKSYIEASSQYEADSIKNITTTHYNLSQAHQKEFKIYPLSNSYEGLDGSQPLIYPKKNLFYYNKASQSYSYIAKGERLSYRLGMSSTGTILLRSYIREDKKDKQYLMDIEESSNRGIALYRGSDTYLYIVVNGSTEKTSLSMTNNQWHSVGISFTEASTSDSTTTTLYKAVRVYLDGKSYSRDFPISARMNSLTLNLGSRKDGSYALYGQISMVVTKEAYCELSTLDSLAEEIKSTKR